VQTCAAKIANKKISQTAADSVLKNAWWSEMKGDVQVLGADLLE
jgi:hypothetical protein